MDEAESRNSVHQGGSGVTELLFAVQMYWVGDMKELWGMIVENGKKEKKKEKKSRDKSKRVTWGSPPAKWWVRQEYASGMELCSAVIQCLVSV